MTGMLVEALTASAMGFEGPDKIKFAAPGPVSCPTFTVNGFIGSLPLLTIVNSRLWKGGVFFEK